MQPVPAARGCLLLLAQASATMAEPLPARGGSSKLHVACSLVEAVLAELIALQRQGALDPAAWDVAVVAVRGQDASAEVVSLLPGTRDDDPFVPLPALAQNEGCSIEPPPAEGAGPRALAHAIRLVHAWSRRHDRILRPIVVHCADEAGCSADQARLARSLALFRGRCGSPGVLTCAFSTRHDETLSFPVNGVELGEPWKTTWETSLTLRRPAEGRAFWLNDLPTSTIVRVVRAVSKTSAGATECWDGPPVACRVHTLWAPKDGHSDAECEDAFATGDGLAAVVDGAAQGIFVRQWAEILAERFRDGTPDLSDPAAWLKDCRARWKAGINYASLHGLAQDKVDRLGAHATFLGLRLHRVQGKVRWRACAVGDSCLFWLRGPEHQLLASFPLTRSAEFGITPELVGSVSRLAPPVRVVTAEGVGKDGDSFALATDAVAQFLLRCYEQGQNPGWTAYWDMSPDDWRAEVQRLRDERLLVNDDSTLVLLRPDG